MMKVAHIVPAMDIGGVEIAIQRSLEAMRAELDYRVFYVRRHGKLDCDQRPWHAFFSDWLAGRWRPDVVLTSLWWAHPFGWVASLAGIRWVAFFHNSGYSHAADRIVLNWAWRQAWRCIVDSEATAIAMRRATRNGRGAELVPYVFPDSHATPTWDSRDIDFVWVGRASVIKRLDLLATFLRLASGPIRGAKVTVALAGTTPAELSNLQLPSDWRVSIRENTSNLDVLRLLRRSKFYLLFSDHEGMSMSTVEAVQAGCVAVVRPVGEIPRYLDELSCIRIPSIGELELRDAADRVARLSIAPEAIEYMRQRARARVGQLPTYVASLLRALRDMREAA